MNLTAQQQSLIRSLLKIIGGALAAHGLTRAAAVINAGDSIELIFGVASAIYGYWLSHQKAQQIPVVAVPTGVADASGNTQFVVKAANATITKSDPTPRNITLPALETVQTSPETPQAKPA
jgi:hypothetical protein